MNIVTNKLKTFLKQKTARLSSISFVFYCFANFLCISLFLRLMYFIIIIIIAAFIMRTYPSSEDVQGATYYYYPGRWIQFQDRTYSAQFPLPREHSLPSCLSWRSGKYIHNIILHILPGTHLYTWVESSNVDKVSCWRTKCRALTGIEPATLWSRVKGSLQYTPAPVFLFGIV